MTNSPLPFISPNSVIWPPSSVRVAPLPISTSLTSATSLPAITGMRVAVPLMVTSEPPPGTVRLAQLPAANQSLLSAPVHK